MKILKYIITFIASVIVSIVYPICAIIIIVSEKAEILLKKAYLRVRGVKWKSIKVNYQR